jgi:hypothetical protein
MESEPTKVTISTHNVNGFKGSKDFLYSLCDQYPDAIRGIQEHWLKPPYKKIQGVNQLRALHPDFDGYGCSAMKKKLEQGIRYGHPFGGTGFLFNKQGDHLIPRREGIATQPVFLFLLLFSKQSRRN